MIKVVVTTYVPETGHPRASYLGTTLASLYRNLGAPESIEFLIANDGPHNDSNVLEVAIDVFGNYTGWYVAGGPRAGIGGSLNRALREVAQDDLWMYTTDDWKLNYRYGLSQAVRLIREQDYDYVRLGPPHPNVVCQTKYEQGLGFWLELWPKGGGFAFATRPFVATKQFYEKIGPFKEHCDAYVCERDYSDRVTDMWSHVRLAEVVNGSFEGPWQHIGEVEVGDRYP